MLAVVAGTLLTFLLANAFPIVDLEVQGIRNGTTVLGSILALWSEGRQPVAMLVFVTIVLFPLIDLSAVLALFVLAAQPRRPEAAFALLFRCVRALRPWGMIEVFLLGILVTLVKLSHMAHVVPGIALWAFAALTVLMAVVVSFDLRSLWLDKSGAQSP